MNIRKMIAGGVTALLAAGALAVGIATPAAAHTPTAWATCETLTVAATYYEEQPAQGEPQITIDNPDYVPAAPAEYVTEYEFVHKNEDHPQSPRWEREGWNADGNENSVGWTSTGNTRQTEVKPATPAVGEPQITVDNPDYQPGNATPNTVLVQIDGETVDSASFGESFNRSYALGDKYIAHAWSVTITAWNDPDGSKGWTKTISGISEPCERPVLPEPDPEKLSGTILIDCEAETVTFAVQNDNDFEVQVSTGFDQDGDGTADFGDGIIAGPNDSGSIVYTYDMLRPWPTLTAYMFLWDGETQGHVIATSDEFSTAGCEEPEVPENPGPRVEYGEWQTGEFDCDDTTVQITRTVTSTEQVWNGEAYVDGESVTTTQTETRALTDEEIASLECEVPPTEEPEEPTTPTKPEQPKPAQPVAAANTVTDTETLAQTGSEGGEWIAVGVLGFLVLVAGGTLLAADRGLIRRK